MNDIQKSQANLTRFFLLTFVAIFLAFCDNSSAILSGKSCDSESEIIITVNYFVAGYQQSGAEVYAYRDHARYDFEETERGVHVGSVYGLGNIRITAEADGAYPATANLEPDENGCYPSVIEVTIDAWDIETP